MHDITSHQLKMILFLEDKGFSSSKYNEEGCTFFKTPKGNVSVLTWDEVGNIYNSLKKKNKRRRK